MLQHWKYFCIRKEPLLLILLLLVVPPSILDWKRFVVETRPEHCLVAVHSCSFKHALYCETKAKHGQSALNVDANAAPSP